MNYTLQVRVVDGLVDCDFEDTCVMELLTDFMAELVADGELILARALRSKFIQKFEQRKARLLPELDTSGLSLLSKFDNPQIYHLFIIMEENTSLPKYISKIIVI
jgi:hypothetical protein